MTKNAFLSRRRAIMTLVRAANELYETGAVMEAKLIMIDAARLLLSPESTHARQLPPKLKYGLQRLSESNQISRRDWCQFRIANKECSVRSLRVLFNLVMRLLARMAKLVVDGESIVQLDEGDSFHVYKHGQFVGWHIHLARLLLALRLQRFAALYARITIERLLGVTKRLTHTKRTDALVKFGVITPSEKNTLQAAYGNLSRSVHGKYVPLYETKLAISTVGCFRSTLSSRLEAVTC